MLKIYIVTPLLIIGAFLVTFIIIPKITWIVKKLKLTDKADTRSSHKNAIPTMGGFSFFIAIILIVFFIKRWDTELIAINFITSITIIFMIGFKDDLVLSSPKAKAIGQLVAILFLFLSGLFKNISLDGFLGIYEVPMVLSFLFLTFIMLAIINSFNLIDGVDGLAGTVGIVIFIVYAVIFFATGFYFYGLLSSSLVGVLTAYLVYNFSESKKIFMGDTGSLLIGFCISFFTLKFISMDASYFWYTNFHAHDKLLIAFVILSIPLFDTSRVIVIRLLQKKSPFYPDRNHIHHVLIDAGLSHKKTSLILGILNLIIVGVFLHLSTRLDNSFQLLFILIGSYLLLLVPFYILKQKTSNKKPFKYQLKK
ncbi:MraY family glycosyltransferase [Polaribacter sp. IC073]|uniref:MraY family glycosyltransferase n=1 Tax=Polaribacter sp. IC073 TaxID=2508540 RepID=UPI0011BF832D|nr:MraY family glycosyltransferase [Polaribacter sp. IC073]TXD47765.1 undecaprenyl/decaprenyl-phosphate alpha-N-acetylglucosaminyl 1-phosphate transferase [Polaribacter sp. IC073]